MGLSNAYGIDANSLGEPFSLLTSILLILGLAQLGLLLDKFFTSSIYRKTNQQPLSLDKIVRAPIYGACIIGVLLFPMILFGSHARQLLFFIALLLCIFGLYFIQSLIRLNVLSLNNLITHYIKLKSASAPYVFCVLFLFGYMLLASAPPTDADDLDYHTGVALALLNQGSWPFAPEWFHSRLAGAGESLIALGYVIGAKQFGSLLQFCGLACISVLLMWRNGNNPTKSSAWVALLFLCSPVLLWLTSTSKPLLLPIAMTILALWHSTQALRISSPSKQELLFNFTTAIFLIALASQMKFNFLLSGFLVGTIAIYVMYRFNLVQLAIPIAALISGIVLLPFSAWKQIHYGGNLINNLYTLFPGNWPGYNAFEAYLRGYDESSFVFPISLIVSTPNQVTNLIGLGVIAWIIGLIWLLRNWPSIPSDAKIMSIASFVLVLLGSLLGQHGGRFYLEPLAWMLLALISCKHLPPIFISRIGRSTLYIQGVITTIGLVVCIYMLLPGSLTESMYKSIMQERAYQYSEMSQIEASLPINAVLLTDSRSIALSSRPSLSAMGWPTYVESDGGDYSPYLELIKKSGVTHFQTSQPLEKSQWRNCITSKPLLVTNSQHNSRNPLNSGSPYRVWLYSFDSAKLPSCFEPLN